MQPGFFIYVAAKGKELLPYMVGVRGCDRRFMFPLEELENVVVAAAEHDLLNDRSNAPQTLNRTYDTTGYQLNIGGWGKGRENDGAILVENGYVLVTWTAYPNV